MGSHLRDWQELTSWCCLESHCCGSRGLALLMELMEGLVWGGWSLPRRSWFTEIIFNVFSRDQVQSISHPQPFLVELLYFR